MIISRNKEKDLDCTVIGDVFIDVTVAVHPDQMLLSNGGTSYGDYAKAAFGGSGNIASGLAKLEGKAAFIGKGGTDFFKKSYTNDLKNQGVYTKIFIDRNLPTGLLLNFVEGEQRSFLVFRGANDNLLPSEIESVTELFKRSKYVYFSGFSLVSSPQKEAILRAVKIARQFDTKIMFDPGAHNIIKSQNQFFNEVLSFCDVLSLNLEEGKAFTGQSDLDTISNLFLKKVPLTTLRCGSQGCIMISHKTILKIPGFKVNCIDPTGAGDAFNAALIYGLTHKTSLESTSKLANWFASQLITQFGARTFPKTHEIKRFLHKLK